MSISDKKADIIKILDHVNDEDLINEVYALLHSESNTLEKFDIKDFPPALQTKLNKAIEDYKSGNYINHELMKEKIQSWRMK